METGKLLLIGRPLSRKFYVVGWILIALNLGVWVFKLAVQHRPIGSIFLLVTSVPLLLSLLCPGIRLFENGIALHVLPSRFFRWEEIHGYRWDGRVLTIKPEHSMFPTGDVMDGCTVRVPKASSQGSIRSYRQRSAIGSVGPSFNRVITIKS